MSPTHKSQLFRCAGQSALIGAALALGACSSDSDTDYGQMTNVARAVVTGSTSSNVTLQQAAAVPHPTMGIRVGDSSEAMLVLASNSEGSLLWRAGSNVAIMTLDGRLKQTTGLDHDLSHLTESGGQTFSPSAALAAPMRSQWTVDLKDLHVYSAALTCQTRPAVADPVTVLGKQISTQRVDEDCQSAALNWSFTNSYWVSPATGNVWKSIQHVHPKLDAIALEMFRPPASD